MTSDVDILLLTTQTKLDINMVLYSDVTTSVWNPVKQVVGPHALNLKS